MAAFLFGVHWVHSEQEQVNDWKPINEQQGNPMYLTLGAAAKETGKSKGTISKYLKNGKLSYHSKDDKGYKIDPAELFRVFPKIEQETGTSERLETPSEPYNLHLENMKLELELEVARKEIKQLELGKDELKEERNEWREQAKRLALPNPEIAPKPLETHVGQPNGFWGWLRTTK